MPKSQSKKIKRTPKQHFRLFLKILLVAIMIIAVLCASGVLVSVVGMKSNFNFISSLKSVQYENQLKPETDDNGCFTFTTDDEFKVLQITDVHIGGGFMSIKKDTKALNAVAAMVSEEAPDLVVVTGDISYPVPFQAGTFNNKTGAKLFAQLMEQLEVYWVPVFGNHDTEVYSYYSREAMSDFYSDSEKYPHCLFNAGPVDVDGEGNQILKIKNSSGKITQCLIMLDSHSYVDNDYFGIMWKYDTIHKNQVEWYEQQLLSIQKENGGKMPKSLAFFHISLPEYRQAWYEYRDNGYKDTENVQYKFGKAGEQDVVVYCSDYNYGFFDKALELGSTQGMFCGHDHMNNFSVEYKGIRLTYGFSIDYLAYSGIMKFGLQRGCTVIDISPDGSFDCHQENYYQDKYQPKMEKEDVDLQHNYYDARS